MFAVGTLIAERPPHRSRRALLTHRAPPSGRTSAARGLETACAPAHSRQSDRRGISAQCPTPRPPVGCSPRVRPFPPRPPPEVAFLCSVASSVLRPHPTSHPRTCSACGFCLPEPARHTSGHGGDLAGSAQRTSPHAH